MPKKKAGVLERDDIARIARCLERLEDTLALSIIARHGTDEDRATILRHLKSQYEAFTEKK